MNKNKGFTFIELIIAVTLFSIIAVSVYSVFRAGIQLWDRTNPLIQANQSTRFFFNTISSDLKNSVSYKLKGVKPDKIVNFEGERQKISFMTLIEVSEGGALPHTELAKVTYSYDRSKKTVNRLVASKAEGLSSDQARQSEILSGIEDKDFGFKYCYKITLSPKEYDIEWKDIWEDEDRDKGKIPRGVIVKAGRYSKTIFIPTGKLGGKDGDK